MAPIKLLAIDLDGTLVDSAPDIAHCLDEAMRAVGRAAPGEARARGWIGDGIETLIQRALAASAGAAAASDAFGRALEVFSACYRINLFERSQLYPDAPAVLHALAGAGVQLCCITNKRVAYAEELLARAGVRERFELVFGGDSLAEKKPSAMPLTTAARELGVAPEYAAMVGDSHHDLDAARAAGYALFIWATYGYCAALNEQPDDRIIRIARFGEIPGLLNASVERS